MLFAAFVRGYFVVACCRPRSFMVVRGRLWLFVVVRGGQPWSFVVVRGHLLSLVGICSHSRSLAAISVFCGFRGWSRSFVVVRGRSRSSVVICGRSWSFAVIRCDLVIFRGHT